MKRKIFMHHVSRILANYFRGTALVIRKGNSTCQSLLFPDSMAAAVMKLPPNSASNWGIVISIKRLMAQIATDAAFIPSGNRRFFGDTTKSRAFGIALWLGRYPHVIAQVSNWGE
ncbi:MAG: hypothetical protein U0401_12605 [Anaerolineae bacterium]